MGAYSRVGEAALGVGVEGDAADEAREAALGIGVERGGADHQGAAASLVGEEVRTWASLAHSEVDGAEHQESESGERLHVEVGIVAWFAWLE